MKTLTNLKLTFYTLLFLFLTTCSDDDTLQYRLTTRVTPSEAGTISPVSGMYNEGTEIELKATPNQEYIFKNWTGDATGNENPLKIVMLKDKTITAVFEKVNYALTLDIIGEGTVNQEIVLAKSSTTDYESGTIVQLTAVPDQEWRFVAWSGDHSSTQNPIQLQMDQAMNITATFEKVSYPLTIEVQGNGTVNEEIVQPKPASKDYDSGTIVQLTALPEAGWIFVAWSGDHTATENPIQITIDKAMTIVAAFEPEEQEKIYVPDDNFEKALIDLGYDDQMDNYVFRHRIRNVEELRLQNRQIADLTGIEGFENLRILILTNNNLQNLDVSQNSLLQQLICDKNQLTSLDISQNLELGSLVAVENQLTCIQVSRILLWSLNWVGGPAAPWFAFDEGVTLSIDCSVSGEQRTYVPDDGFEQALIDLGLDDIMDDYVKTIDIINILSLDISGKNISDLTGLEDFKGLLTINANNNNISQLDISEWGVFFFFDIRYNQLTCIQVNDDQLATLGGLMLLYTDEGVDVSKDCGY